jgi:hypothetical protein
VFLFSYEDGLNGLLSMVVLVDGRSGEFCPALEWRISVWVSVTMKSEKELFVEFLRQLTQRHTYEKKSMLETGLCCIPLSHARMPYSYYISSTTLSYKPERALLISTEMLQLQKKLPLPVSSFFITFR